MSEASATIKVLLVEDDARLAQLTVRYLEGHGVVVTHASDGVEGQAEALRRQYDCVVLDIMLPGRDGIEVCRQLRSRIDVPIIMVTARGEESDRVLGLEVGADDYVTKPFAVGELLARVRANLRRGDSSTGEERIFRFGDVTVDRETREVVRAGASVELTATEFDVLAALRDASGRILSRRQIMDAVWGETHHGTERTVDNFVAQLRAKLEPDPSAPWVVAPQSRTR